MKGLIKSIVKKTAAVILAATVLFSGFSAFNTAEAARAGFDPKKVGGKVTISFSTDANKLLAGTTTDAYSARVQALIYDSLVATDQQGKIIPSVATKWDVTSDGKQYTFYLRKDVKFHDGKPLTADDVIFTYDILSNKDSIYSYKSNFDLIDKVEKIDNYTIRVKLKDRDVFFLYNFSFGILPKHLLPKGVDDFNNNTKLHRNPIGSGPFKFKEWKTAERIVLTANKDYWDGRPYMDEVIFKILPDTNTEVINLLKGNTDFLESVQAKSIQEVTKDKDLKVMKYDRASFNFIGWNMLDPIFSDTKVRQALTYALDRKTLLEKLNLNNGTLASGPFPPQLSMYDKNIKPYPYDVNKANQLLDQAGWKMGSDGYRVKNGKVLEFEFSYPSSSKLSTDVAKQAQQMWKKIGVKATPRAYDFQIMLEKMDARELQMWIMAWNLGVDGDQYGLWHSSEAPDTKNGKEGLNSSQVNDPRVDKILEQYRVEPDAKKRDELYKQLHKIMNEEQYNLFLWYPKGTAGMNKKLAGVKFTLWNRYWNVIDWYWEK